MYHLHSRREQPRQDTEAEIIDLTEKQAEIIQLATQARDGDKKAFAQLVKLFQPQMMRLARRKYSFYNEADAEDLVQDTLASIWKNIRQLKNPERFRPYLFTALQRKSIDKNKKMKELLARTDEEHDLQSHQRDTSRPFDELLADQELLRKALDSLEPIYRKIFQLFYIEGKSIKEIQKQASKKEKRNVSENTIKSRIRYLKEKLKAYIDEHTDMAA